jgi:hypothetical protein
MKLRSILQYFRWHRAALGLVTLAAAGCGYGNSSGLDDGSGDYPPGDGATCGDVEHASIDTGALLDVSPGLGAGVFIEYEAGGSYRISTSCRVDELGPCSWDIVVTPLDDAGVESVAPLDLEPEYDAVTTDGVSVQLIASTEDDLDGFTLGTAPGATLRVDALIDGSCGNRYFFWMGDGALHSGAPSNPIDLTPSRE